MSQRFRWVLGLAIVAVGLSVALAACGSSKKKSSTTSAASGGTSTQASGGGGATSKCGLGNGKKATGTPIKLGAIATKQPGTDFSDIPNMTKAYFDCVNDNGGINGHPVELVIETEQTDPGQVASLAKKLDRDRQGRRRSSATSTHHRVRGQPQVLRAQGLLRDRRRHRARVLRDARTSRP